MKAKIYKIFAVFFALVGLVLFGYMFSTRVDESGTLSLLDNPATVVLLIFPFIPALIFSVISARAAAKVEQFFDEMESDDNPGP